MTTTTMTPPLPDLELCLVEGGEFMMGDDSVESARPAHRVRVSSFWMSKYPVTQRLWRAVIGDNPSYFIGERRPVEQISWHDAQEFLQKLNGLTEVQAFVRQLDPSGAEFRLPTEAEWEYAARGGRYSQDYKYAGSDRAKQVAWHKENSGDETHEVGLLLQNELNLHDMSGNVCEWCADGFFGKYYAECNQYGTVENPHGPDMERSSHVLRGGSSFTHPQGCQYMSRIDRLSVYRYDYISFRLVLPFQEPVATGARRTVLPSLTTPKSEVILKIEKLLDTVLHPAPFFPNIFDGLMAFKENHPKYLLDEQENLIGLNLAATKLDDTRWQQLVFLLEEHIAYLQALNLCDNQISNFISPPGVAALTALDLDENPIANIPPDVVKSGNIDILKWLKDTGKRPILEAKVMFIGDSNYGKTTLISILKAGSVAKGITTTHGIERCRIRDAESPAGKIRLNVWDLGGQQFMRSTHQLFFTERTLYVLVTEARRERSELNHWLNLVHELAADAPVLVVINKIDLDDHDIDREPLRRDYPNIKGFVRTACFDSQSGGPVQGIAALDTISELEQEIHRIVSDRKLMPSVFAEQRQEWFTVKDALEAMEEDYISYEAYQQRPHIRELPAEEQKQNLKQLAWLGTVVSFIDDHRLNDTHVINPQWLLDGIYRFINDAEIKEQRRGEFSFADFARLLNAQRYPEQKYNFFVELMKKFRLCYQPSFIKNTWLLPDLFTDIEPKNVWPETDVMHFRISYSSFPPDLFITQFIVECYQDIFEEKRWRSGVVLRHEVRSRSGDGIKVTYRPMAIIRRSFRHERIEIEVAGPKTLRRSNLHILLNVFKKIHQPYEPSLKVAREIPYKNIWLDYDDLLEYENAGETFYHPQLKERIPVSEVLDGYGRPGRENTDQEIIKPDQEIIKRLDKLERIHKDHAAEARTDHNRFENKQNKLRHELERYQIELKRAKAIDENKLQEHFVELQALLTQLAQQPEIQHNPELAKQLSELIKEPALANAQLFVYLVPEIIQKFVPMMPNIKLECDLGRMLEKLLALFKKIIS